MSEHVPAADANGAPLTSYAALAGSFVAALATFLVVGRKRLPERVSWDDIGRIALATHKLSRLIAKDEVTSFVRAPVTEDPEATEPAPRGARKAVGELVTCPYCLGLWIAATLSAGVVVRPREARFLCSVFAAHAISDGLNAGFVRLKPSS